MKYGLQAQQFKRDSDKTYQAKSNFPSWITAFAEISSSFPPALVIYNDKFDSKLLHLSKTESKKEMELYEWLIYTLSMEHWKDSTVFWVCPFCLFLSFNKLFISDFCQLLTAKTICLFSACTEKVTIIWLGWFITLESKKKTRGELIKLWHTDPRETVNY